MTMHFFPQALRCTGVLCLTVLLAACQTGGPKKTLEDTANALTKRDSGAFLAQIDSRSYAAHEFVNLKASNELLNGLDTFGQMLGLGSQVNDLLNTVIDLEGRNTKTFTRTVATGELVNQCTKAQTPDCPWVPDALNKAEVKELGPDAAIAKLTTPANMTSWIALRKEGEKWRIVGKAVLEEMATKFANDAKPLPAPNKEVEPQVPEKKNAPANGEKPVTL